MALIDDIKFDLSLKNGTVTGAMIRSFIVLGTFIILPYLIYTFASGNLSEAGDSLFGIDLQEGAWDWVSNMMKYAIPLVLLSIPIGFYRKGSYARIPFKIVFAIYMGSWLWISSQGGVFIVTGVEEMMIEGVSSSITVGIDVKYVVYVMLLICVAMMFLAFSEFAGNRKKYFEWLEKKKDTMSKRKARRLSG